MPNGFIRPTAQNQVLLEQAKRLRRQNEAVDRLPGLLKPITATSPELAVNPITGQPLSAPDVGNLPAAQHAQKTDLMGVLGQIAPQAVAQSVLPTRRSPTGDLALMEAMGLEPTIANLTAVNEAKGKPGADTFAEIQARLGLLDLEKASRDRNEALRLERERLKAESSAKRAVQLSVGDSFRRAKEVIDLQKSLEGTFLAAGGNYSEGLRAVQGGINTLQGLFDGDTAKARRVNASFDRTQKLMAEMFIDTSAKFDALGELTNAKFSLVGKAAPDIQNEAAANALLIAGNMKSALNDAELAGVRIDNAKEIRDFIATMRAENNLAGPGSGATGGGIEGFESLTPEQQALIRDKIQQLFPQLQGQQ